MARLKCPTCGAEGEWDKADSFPFCSERCRMVDLSKWFGEEYRISEPLRPDHFREYEELEGGAELDRPEDTPGSGA